MLISNVAFILRLFARGSIAIGVLFVFYVLSMGVFPHGYAVLGWAVAAFIAWHVGRGLEKDEFESARTPVGALLVAGVVDLCVAWLGQGTEYVDLMLGMGLFVLTCAGLIAASGVGSRQQ